MIQMYTLRLLVSLLVFIFAAKDVYSSHFRGAVIMVRPKLRGAANEVNVGCTLYCIVIKLGATIWGTSTRVLYAISTVTVSIGFWTLVRSYAVNSKHFRSLINLHMHRCSDHDYEVCRGIMRSHWLYNEYHAIICTYMYYIHSYNSSISLYVPRLM